jgi:hypothetical protein
MNPLLSRIWRSPRLSRILLALSMPALVTIGFAPLWAIALCIATVLFSLVFMYAEVLSPKYIQNTGGTALHGKTETPASAPAHAIAAEAPKVVIRPIADVVKADVVKVTAADVPAIVKNWIEYGQEASSALLNAQSEIREAIRMSTSSAIEVGHCVQHIQANHDAQVLLARNLLDSTESGSEQNLSLADLAATAAEALDHQSRQMAQTAENAFYLVERQQMASLIALRVDDLLAEADKAARELTMNALSPQDGVAKPIDPLQFSKNYRNTIRELRGGLDAIRQSLAQATGDLQNNVNQLKGAANLGKAEVDSVSRDIGAKLAETRQTMKRLTDLSQDTDNHIRSAVVAMQYHDITTQKLAAVEASKLQFLVDQTQTILASSNRQFPDLAPAVLRTKANDEKHSGGGISNARKAEIASAQLAAQLAAHSAASGPPSVDLFE